MVHRLATGWRCEVLPDILRERMAIERLYITLGRQLRRWGVASLALGAVSVAASVLLQSRAGFVLMGIGIQFCIWGLVDGIVAATSRRKGKRVLDREPDEEWETQQFLRLRRTLLVNGGLDVFYIAVGVAVALLIPGDAALGHGVGIVIQALFLLAFDVYHGARLPKVPAAWYDPQP